MESLTAKSRFAVVPHFQNRTVTTRFVGVPTDFKIELLQPGLQ
ncbi:hypothetical protein LEP1GSC019_3938 [Leptospira interrogans serovar Pyrogenes str. 2006006960]|nr:hypothetical protein [Leptospira interrogans]EKR19913.1 hypothetical protein LEP1GSC019_3938 [Leptospira interrogans serovar Pyrogenes str. 2006006960]